MYIAKGGRRCTVLCAVLVVAQLGSAKAALVSTQTDASLAIVACNGRVGFRTSEANQAAMDLNGDLDPFDFVFQVLDLGTAAITPVPKDASGPLACGGNLFAFGVGEANQGNVDVTLDGDTNDFILNVYDAAAATLTNVGLPVTRVVASPTLVVFTVPEASMGPGGTDLNGDTDKVDNVLHVFDPSTSTTTNVGREASSDILVVGSRVAFLTSESAQAGDLNGDLDTLDNVLHTYDAATATLTNTGFQSDPGIQFDGNTVAFLVSEPGQNQLLNPDADNRDSVLHLYCLSSPPCVSLGAINTQKAAGKGFTFAGDFVAFKIPERGQLGLDLTGDGDTGDQVVHVYRVSTNTVTNTGFSTSGTPRIEGSFVALRVRERNQGTADLNGDGDKNDAVMHVYNITANTTTNTQRAVGLGCKSIDPVTGDCFMVRGDLLVMETDERRQGKTDLNGDLDTKDLVVEVWRLSTATLLSSGRATERTSGLAVGNSIVGFRRSERRERTILNGDFDTKDGVMAVFDTATSTASNLANETELGFLVEGNTVVFRTAEGAQASDLNLDADFTDTILQYQAF
jgi:hypothetical protein